MAQEPEIISQTVTQSTTSSVSYQYGWRWGWWGWNWGWAWNWGRYWQADYRLGWNYNWWSQSNWGWWNWNNWNNYAYWNRGWGYGYSWGWNWGWWQPWVRVIRTTTTTTTTTTDRVLAKNEIPFMRSRDVNFSVTGLRPFTKFYAFFDNVHVSNYCANIGFAGKGTTTVGSNILSGMVFASGNIGTNWVITGPGIPEGTTVSSIASPGVDGTITQLTMSKPATLNVVNQAYSFSDGTPNFGSALVSDQYGKLSGVFKIPNSNSLRFRVGARLFKVSDVMNPSVEEESSWADALYIARGVIETRQRTVFRDVRIRYDPLAQSFITDGKEFDGGIMVTGVGVYFATKDQTVPVTCELRTMVNGYPGEDLVHPLARTSLEANQISVSTDASVETTFYFPRPIYLEQDQDYCFVLRSGSNKYNVYIATMGQLKINSIQSVSKQPYIGSLFLSQNNSTWTADQWSDMKFNLYKAKFDITKTAEVVFKNAVPDNKAGSGPVCELVSGSTAVVVRAPDHGMNVDSKVAVRVNAFQGVIASGYNIVSEVPTEIVDRVTDAIIKAGGPIPIGGVFTTDTGLTGLNITSASGTSLTLSGNATASGLRNLSYGYVRIDNTSTSTALAAYQICGIKDVDWADYRTFVITSGAAPSASGIGWVDSMVIEPDYRMDQAFLSADVENVSGTEIQTYRKATSGKSVDGTQTAYSKESNWVSAQINSDTTFNGPMLLASQANLDTNLAMNGSSYDVKFVLTSKNANVSPVIDGESVNLVAVTNLMGNPDQVLAADGTSNRPYDHVVLSVALSSGVGTTTLTPSSVSKKFGSSTISASIANIKVGAKVYWNGGSTTVTAVGATTFTTSSNVTSANVYILNPDTLETAPVGGISPSKYIIKPVKLETPATSLRVMFAGNVVNGNNIDVYYKALSPSSAATLDTTNWTLMSLANNATMKYAANKDEFLDYTFEVKTLPEFQTFQVKVVMRGTNSATPPRIKEFRTLALAV